MRSPSHKIPCNCPSCPVTASDLTAPRMNSCQRTSLEGDLRPVDPFAHDECQGKDEESNRDNLVHDSHAPNCCAEVSYIARVSDEPVVCVSLVEGWKRLSRRYSADTCSRSACGMTAP